jgi:hypothetical protein
MEISRLVEGIKIYIKEYSKLAKESGIIRRDISEFLQKQLKDILGYTEEESEFIVTKSNIILTDSEYAHIIESIKQDSVAEGTIEKIINMSSAQDSVLKGWGDSYERLKSIPGGKKTKRCYKSKAKKSKRVKKTRRKSGKKSKTYKK